MFVSKEFYLAVFNTGCVSITVMILGWERYIIWKNQIFGLEGLSVMEDATHVTPTVPVCVCVHVVSAPTGVSLTFTARA